jgi:hypothetical protein
MSTKSVVERVIAPTEPAHAASVKFTLDGKVVSDEVSAAFFDKPLLVVEPAVVTECLVFDDQPEPKRTTYKHPETLDAPTVTKMLATDKGEWKLAVLKDDTTGVLDGELLKKAWERGRGTLEFPLRSPTPAEKLVLDDSDALYGPSASWDRVKDAVGYPVAQAGLIATAAGLFGLLALQSDIERPWAMKAATLVAAVATSVSAFWGFWQKAIEEKPARLDLLRSHQRNVFNKAIARARIGIGLLLSAVALAIVATWPTGSAKSASATIGNPTVSAPKAGVKGISLPVNWSGLDKTVASVSSTIGSSRRSTPKSSGSGSVEQTLETNVPARTRSVRVETRALDAQRQQVGVGYTKQVTLPSG